MESGEIKGVGPSSASALAGEEKKQELAMKEEDEGIFGKFKPGPLLPLKEHIEKDKVVFCIRFLNYAPLLILLCFEITRN